MKSAIYIGTGVISMLMVFAACNGKDPEGTGATEGTTGATTATTTMTSGASDSSTTLTGGVTDSMGSASDSTTMTTTMTTATTTETTGCSFLSCPTDMIIDPPECDVWAQDCPRGEKCAAWANDGGGSWNSLKCVPVPDPAGEPGDECTVEGSGVSGLDSCALGGMCWNVDPETNMGYCIALCDGDASACSMPGNTCCDAGETCTIVNMGVLILCLPGCDPLQQDCMNGDTCIPNPDGQTFICVLDASGDMGAAGDPCEFANVCDPGLYCIDSGAVEGGCGGATGCCSPWCNLTDPAPCPHPMEECVAWYEPGTEPPGLADVGICALPQ